MLFACLRHLWNGARPAVRSVSRCQKRRTSCTLVVEPLDERILMSASASAALVGPSPMAPPTAGVSVLLPIPARQQWEEFAGYCGETSIQSFALYNGTYVSEFQVRAMIGPSQLAKNQVLIGVNEQIPLTNLHLTFDQWNYNIGAHLPPQYHAYMKWVEQELQAGHPVIGTVYLKGYHDPDYDHIIPFIGYQSSSATPGYHPDDVLAFYDNFDPNTHLRYFNTLNATRAGANSGTYPYYIPTQIDYGCAVTGIVDPNHETMPIRLSVNRWNEPNIPLGEKPVTMQGALSITSLTPGTTYALLRYDNYHNVPNANFLAAGGYTWDHQFTATSTTQAFADSFQSDGCVIYRCVAVPPSTPATTTQPGSNIVRASNPSLTTTNGNPALTVLSPGSANSGTTLTAPTNSGTSSGMRTDAPTITHPTLATIGDDGRTVLTDSLGNATTTDATLTLM